MAVNKDALMKKLYGICPGEKCEDCSHLHRYLYHDRYYFKCDVYGETNSEASDWRKGYEACGLHNAETTEHDIIRLVKPDRKAELLNEPLPGQIDFFEEGEK